MTIYEDIATLFPLKTSSLLIIEKLFKFVVNSSPGEFNASKLSKIFNKYFDSISNYLTYLKQSWLIRFIYPKKSGKAFLKKPVKMYPDNTNLIFSIDLPLIDDQVKGKIRETFALNQFQNIEKSIFYSKIGGFEIENYILEIGGKSKNFKQIINEKNTFIFADDIVVGAKKNHPLVFVGFVILNLQVIDY